MTKKKLTDKELQKLATRIKNAIDNNDGSINDQQDQIKRLLELECQFRNYICRYSRGMDVYKLFIEQFLPGKNNILKAQSYFREKSNVFRKYISIAIKEQNPYKLMEFNVNYQFIKFIVDNWDQDGSVLPIRAQNYYNDLVKLRNTLIENNLPLAINRAKIFYKKTPRSHLGLLDLIDICVYGLIVGVDKFVGNQYNNWAGVAIGRMVGFMIEEYSKSFIKLYPSEKKILYRANALKYRLNITDIQELTDAVNESFEIDKEEGKAAPNYKITEVQIRTLMNSSNYTSANTTVNDGEEDDNGGSIYDYTADSESLEEQIEKKDILNKILTISQDLNMIEKKIIKLKGIDL